MSKFNLYKINPTQRDELVKKFQSVGLSKIGSKNIEGFTLDFYFSKEPDAVDIWWTDDYKDFSEQQRNQKIKYILQHYLSITPKLFTRLALVSRIFT